MDMCVAQGGHSNMQHVCKSKLRCIHITSVYQREILCCLNIQFIYTKQLLVYYEFKIE